MTLVATGWMMHRALEAAERLALCDIDVEVVDPRTIKPLDEKLILRSIQKTGRLVTLHEACLTGGFGAEVSAIVAEKAYDALKCPVKRIASPDHIIPFSPPLEDAFYPSIDRIVEEIKNMFS